MSGCSSVPLSLSLPPCLSFSQAVGLPVCSPNCLIVCACLSFRLPLFPSLVYTLGLSFCLSVCQPVCLSVCQSVNLSVCLCVCVPSLSLFGWVLKPVLSLPLSLFVSIYLSVCLLPPTPPPQSFTPSPLSLFPSLSDCDLLFPSQWPSYNIALSSRPLMFIPTNSCHAQSQAKPTWKPAVGVAL